jgi:hypothetical protein
MRPGASLDATRSTQSSSSETNSDAVWSGNLYVDWLPMVATTSSSPATAGTVNVTPVPATSVKLSSIVCRSAGPRNTESRVK